MYARAKEFMLLMPAPEDHQAVVSISEAVSPIPLRMKKGSAWIVSSKL